MKALFKLFIFMLYCTAAVSLVSCLGDGDDGGISDNDYKTYMSIMSGYYYDGRMYFQNDTITSSSNTNKVDSVNNISVMVYTDSTLIVQNVPGRLLAKCITGHDELKQAIEDAGNKNITAAYLLSSVSNNSVFFYYVLPASVTWDALTYNGNTHKVQIAFYSPSSGAYYGGAVDFTLYMAGVYQDGDLLQLFYDDDSSESEQKDAVLEIYASKY